MTFVTGSDKVVIIGPNNFVGGQNALEIILRPQGRYIARTKRGFVARSEKKTKSFAVSGTSTNTSELFYEYETPGAGDHTFEKTDLFPQEIVNDYPVDTQRLYGIMGLVDISVSSDPADNDDSRIYGVWVKNWISKQPMSSWSDEDCVRIGFFAYTGGSTLFAAGGTGVRLGTVKKMLVPSFIPIKSWMHLRKTDDKLYVYTDVVAAGKSGGTITTPGAFAATVGIDYRAVTGLGFLPEEVEHMLSARL